MCCSQGANTRIPQSPQTTDGITASRSITYTIGRDQRYGTTSVSSMAIPTLTGAAISARSALMTLPYTWVIAPNWLLPGFHWVEKMPFRPAVLNHDEACWVIETAIRTRITRTTRQAAAARIWKPRSPSGRRWARGLADPAGMAGSAFVTVLTMQNPPELPASQGSPRDLTELRHGLLVDVGG